jgi:glycosyltransferase involved in cell wall biosynthesis
MSKHLVLIPSYNTGARLAGTVREVLRTGATVWVVIDGSTDGSERDLIPLAQAHDALRVIRRAANGGKGAAGL